MGTGLGDAPRECLKIQNWGQRAKTALTSQAENRQSSALQPQDSPKEGIHIQNCIMGSFPGCVMSFPRETKYFICKVEITNLPQFPWSL